VHNRMVLLIVTDDVRLESGRILERELRSRIPDIRVIYVDPTIANAMAPEILKAANEAEEIVTAVYAAPVPGARTFTNEITSVDPTGRLIYQILDQAPRKTTVIAVGNPYFAKDFPSIETYLCTFSNGSVSELSAAKAIFGEIPIHGHLPVTIPSIASRGAGIERPALQK
jgi:beta-N-acetylhexosaminidase